MSNFIRPIGLGHFTTRGTDLSLDREDDLRTAERVATSACFRAQRDLATARRRRGNGLGRCNAPKGSKKRNDQEHRARRAGTLGEQPDEGRPTKGCDDADAATLD